MDPDTPKHRFQHRQAEEQTSEQDHAAQQRTDRTFDSVEDMLRFDLAQTEPPPSIAERLQGSLQAEPQKRPWWRRLFKR
ncbi:MAG TPA: hypothetical protein VMP11_00720 [Verrucomicrobiae bacterium]|nr:hypothetical protein [Verrucomicrobiae bacterium]